MADERDIPHFNKMANESKQTAVEWYTKQILEYKSPTNINGTDYFLIPVNKVDFLQEQAKEMEKEQITNAYSLGVKEDGIWVKDEILDFLYNEITERRDYSASKMCEVVVDFIENI
jgi:hypothetical protein